MIIINIGGIGVQMKNRDSLDHSIVRMGWNTEESPRVGRGFAVTQTPVKYDEEILI